MASYRRLTLLLVTMSAYLIGLSTASSPPFDPDCKALPCPEPLCDNPQMTTVIQDGKVCPGCPVCPPDNQCKDLPRCTQLLCPAIFCPGASPTCGFENNRFCRGCDRCPTCSSIQCPRPEGRCRKFEPLKLESGEICNDCNVCVDDFTPCPEITCLAVQPFCPRDRFRQNPLHLNGRICLGCASCQCPSFPCTQCDITADNFPLIRDLSGCQTSCPACEVKFKGICSRVRCGPPPIECQKIRYLRGPDGEVCTLCARCADDLQVCEGFQCPSLSNSCPNKTAHDVVTIDGQECLSCPVCSDLPKCETLVCPACVPVDNWQSPVDENGCDTQCPPCKIDRPLCPRWKRLWCQPEDYEEVRIGRRTCLGCPYRRGR